MDESQSPWYADHRFAKYWKHYESVNDWFRYHFQVESMCGYSNLDHEMRWNELARIYQNQMTWWQRFYADSPHPSSFYQWDDGSTTMSPEDGSTDDTACPSTVTDHCSSSSPMRSHHKRGKRRRRLSKKRKKAASRARRETTPLTLEVHSTADDEAMDYEMEITEDMLEFFAASAKYKIERGNLVKINFM